MSCRGAALSPLKILFPAPWNPHTRLLRIGIKSSDRAVAELAQANLVFLVDVCGSMDRREVCRPSMRVVYFASSCGVIACVRA